MDQEIPPRPSRQWWVFGVTLVILAAGLALGIVLVAKHKNPIRCYDAFSGAPATTIVSGIYSRDVVCHR